MGTVIFDSAPAVEETYRKDAQQLAGVASFETSIEEALPSGLRLPAFYGQVLKTLSTSRRRDLERARKMHSPQLNQDLRKSAR